MGIADGMARRIAVVACGVIGAVVLAACSSSSGGSSSSSTAVVSSSASGDRLDHPVLDGFFIADRNPAGIDRLNYQPESET